MAGISIKKPSKKAQSNTKPEGTRVKRSVMGPSMQSVKISAISLLALGVFGHGAALADDEALRGAGLSSTLHNETVLETAISAKPSVPAVDYVAPKISKKLLIGGAMALILAAIGKLVGANRLMNIFANAGPAVKKAAETMAHAPAAAAKMVGSAMMSPVKFLVLVGGLAMIGFTGISVFDLHWSAGIITGIGMSAMAWAGAQRMMKTLAPIKARIRENPFTRSRR